VGLDTPWSSPRGFQATVGSALQSYLQDETEGFETFFFSFQRRRYGALRAEDYVPAFRELSRLAGRFAKRVNLHHTMLNLGSMLPYDRRDILRVTNEVSEEVPFGWINEDVGIWFLEGKSIPYPLPPILTRDSLVKCIETVKQVKSELHCPLSIEFPGVTDGASFFIGDMDLYEYFAELADQTQSLVTLDTGHLLGWEWNQGRMGDELLKHLENFPFHQVIEIHMAGSESKNGKFIDRHHGILLNEQFEILDFLLPRCKNLQVLTFEDPKFDLQGKLIEAARPSLRKLKETVKQWNLFNSLRHKNSNMSSPILFSGMNL
jgi:uncharacterized protein (UPF0276 family)